MADLKHISEEELIAELERRKTEKIPQPLENKDFYHLIETVKEYIDSVSRNTADDDEKHWIYEAAVEAVYGKDIFKWMAEQQDQ